MYLETHATNLKPLLKTSLPTEARTSLASWNKLQNNITFR